MELLFPLSLLLGTCAASGYYTFKFLRRKASLLIAVICSVLAVPIPWLLTILVLEVWSSAALGPGMK